jgi:hypothetical protein
MGNDRFRKSDADGILPVAIGTGAWVVVLVALLANWGRLDENETLWWVGAAGVGVLSGSLGLVFLRWRKARGRAAEG